MNSILVITTEPLPVPGGLTTGAGLRAWGLAEGLRSRGLPVTLATPLEGEQALAQATSPTDDRVIYFRRSELGDVIRQVNPNVVVMQHWGLMYAVPPLDVPLVIDLAGPHLLERHYWGNRDAARDLEEKIQALRRADFVICGGQYQRHYFYPYLAQAGFDLVTDAFPVIPFSVSPDAPRGTPPPDAEPTFIYGGAFLAWQNPEKAIRWLLDEMDKAGRGRLRFYGGAHPSMDASGGRFVALYKTLQHHPRVELCGWKPFAELTAEYAEKGHVALDLMQRNPERELAYTTRTMVYLQCGLPVIYNDYSEISHLIQANDCGWCLNPDDEAGFRKLVSEILTDPTVALKKRDAARSAALSQSWDKTIGPLADFCENPVRREHPEAMPVPSSDTLSNNSSLLQNNALANESFFTNKGIYAGTLLYFPVWVLSKFLYYRFKCEVFSRAL